MSRVFLASRNAKKLAEMQRILRQHLPSVEVLGLDDVPAYDEPVEDQPTFEGNALLKARAGLAHTGLPSLADDSGLCVDALNGMPGVLSARWAGPPVRRTDGPRNNDAAAGPARRRTGRASGRPLHLLRRLLRARRRRDRRRGPDARAVIRETRGTGGFGYDVVFVADDHPGPTTAELSIEDKDAISHRGKALRELAPLVARSLGSGG